MVPGLNKGPVVVLSIWQSGCWAQGSLRALLWVQQGIPAVPSLEPWALENKASMELPRGMGERNQHGKVKALRLISWVVIATFQPVVFGSCVWMKGTLSVPWRSQRLELCAALWEGPVHFPLHGFLREKGSGVVTCVGMLVFK